MSAGWKYESARHALAAQGVSTRRYNVNLADAIAALKYNPSSLPVAQAGAIATKSFVGSGAGQRQVQQLVPQQLVQSRFLPGVQQVATVAPAAAATTPALQQVAENLFKLPNGSLVMKAADGTFIPAAAQAIPGGAMGLVR